MTTEPLATSPVRTMRTSRTCVQMALIGTIASMLHGCAYLSPYVALRPKIETSSEDASKMPQLAAATARLDAWMDSTEKLHGDVTATRRVLDLATFGLLTAAGVKAAHGGSTNAIKNLAMGGAGTYTASTLFVPTAQSAVYSNGTVALHCLRTRATSLHSAVITASAMESSSAAEDDVKSVYAQCPQDAQTTKNLSSAIGTRSRAIGVLSAIRAADSAVAMKIQNAALNVIVTMNAQLDSLSPDAAALLGSARSIEVLALGMTASPAPASVGFKGAAAGTVCATPPDSESVAALNARLLVQTATYQAYSDSLSQALNSVADLTTACSVSLLPVAALSLSQDRITVVKDSTFNVVVTGGREPLQQPTFIGRPPGDGVRIMLVAPRTIVVTGTSTIQAGTTYVAQIRDASASAGFATLTIDAR